MRAAEDYARTAHLRLVLDVMAKDVSAIRLYQRLGWERLGVATHVYGDGRRTDAICFAAPGTAASRAAPSDP